MSIPTRGSKTPVARRTERGKQRSLVVIDAAARLFLKNGYENTSVDDIIQKAGGSKSHVYQEFGGKEGLFLAVVSHLCDKVQLSLAHVSVDNLSPEEGLQKLASAFLAELLTAQLIAFQRLIFSEAVRFPEAGAIWFERGPQTTQKTFANFIRKKMEEGQLKAGDACSAATLFHDMLAGTLMYKTWLRIDKRPSEDEIAELVRSSVELFLRGYII
jgi:AcrR family transcriptional regulator